jgi:hypothetical protein
LHSTATCSGFLARRSSITVAVARGYPELLAHDDFPILVGDRNVTANKIKAFLEIGDLVPIFEGHEGMLIEKIRRKLSGNSLRNYMPGLRSAVGKATRGFEVYHCTDWFIEPSRHVTLNVITCLDLITTVFPQFYEAKHYERAHEARTASRL